MKFKIIFDEQNNKMGVQCLKSNSDEIILPENADQHILYPIPIELKDKIKKFLDPIVEGTLEEEIIQLNNEIKSIHLLRYEKMSKLRESLNPLIISKCNEFKNMYPEYFI